MPSITPMMSLMRRLLSVICCMECTTCCTTEPPRSAAWAAMPASWLAWRAVSDDCVTVEVSSSMLAAVSSRLAAVCSVRADRSWLPVAIWLDAADTDSTPLRTSPTTARRRTAMRSSAFSRWPNSSLRSTLAWTVRSPLPMDSATCTACSSGWVIVWMILRMTSTSTKASTTTVTAPATARVCCSAWAWAMPASRWRSCSATKSFRLAAYFSAAGRYSWRAKSVRAEKDSDCRTLSSCCMIAATLSASRTTAASPSRSASVCKPCSTALRASAIMVRPSFRRRLNRSSTWGSLVAMAAVAVSRLLRMAPCQRRAAEMLAS